MVALDDEIAGAGSWALREGDEIEPGLTVLEHLGTSRTNDVYLAFDETLLSVVAVKMARRDRDAEDGAGTLVREGRLLTSLQHPAIPRCFAIGEGARPHLVLEFIEGPRLSTLIRRQGRLGPEHVLPLALQLGAAAHYLSTRGLVHLDIKPKNVVMSPSPKLIDLSVAMPIDRAMELRRPVGTDAYMAPEQCGVPGMGPIGPHTDVWGLGVTLYQATSGTLPFERGDADGIGEVRFPQLVGTPRPLPRDVPPDLAEVVLASLAHRGHDRPTAADIASALGDDFRRLPRRLLLGKARVSWGRR